MAVSGSDIKDGVCGSFARQADLRDRYQRTKRQACNSRNAENSGGQAIPGIQLIEGSLHRLAQRCVRRTIGRSSLYTALRPRGALEGFLHLEARRVDSAELIAVSCVPVSAGLAQRHGEHQREVEFAVGVRLAHAWLRAEQLRSDLCHLIARAVSNEHVPHFYSDATASGPTPTRSLDSPGRRPADGSKRSNYSALHCVMSFRVSTSIAARANIGSSPAVPVDAVTASSGECKVKAESTQHLKATSQTMHAPPPRRGPAPEDIVCVSCNSNWTRGTPRGFYWRCSTQSR